MNNNSEGLGQFECPVCFMLLESPVTTSCGHTYCLKCITDSLQSTPKCPLCRYPLLYNSQYLRENTLIKSLIAAQFPNQQPKQMVQQQQQNINLTGQLHSEALPQISLIGSRLALVSSNNLFPCGKQRIFVQQSQFGGIHFDAIKQFLNAAQVIILKPDRQIQSGDDQHDIYGISGTILNVNPQDNKIQIDLMTEERVDIKSIKMVEFKLLQQQQQQEQQQQEQTELIQNTRPQELIFEMLTCSGAIILDDPINLNSADTSEQLKVILENIQNFLKKATTFNADTVDISTITIHAALQKTGLFNYLDASSLNTQESIRKLSLTLSGVLKIPLREKQRMFQTTDVVERLILLNEIIKRYNGITNPMMIFDLDLPNHGSNSLTTNLMLLIGVIVVIIIFSIQNKQ